MQTKTRLFVSSFLLFVLNGMAPYSFAQISPDNKVPAGYPVVELMSMDKLDRTVLLGEKDKQLGTFHTLAKGNTSQIIDKLLQDANAKGWSLSSIIRSGLDYTVIFSKMNRVLQMQLVQRDGSIEIAYAMMPAQQ